MAELGGNIIPINIEDEMKSAYIDYSMSVIVSRAIPDVRDGLKPVHRRVLFGMSDLGLNHNKPYKKSARIVGEVLGKYHPHGDSSVYDTMVRMAQPWSLRYPLVDGQGNFGSVDGDSPAAMRYTEARFKQIAEEVLKDIDKDTVDFSLNFDDTLKEPTVLPSRIPGLLVNGATGIAVGMATNILPHNLTEVINGTIAYINDNEITIDELCKHITAPDFPTGGSIYGYEGVKAGFETGRGRVVVRAKAEIEEMKSGREQIIVTEIPYQVNKSVLIKKTADLVNDKKLEGISDIRDESDRNGMRIVYELKRDAVSNVVLNKLYQYTQLQTSYGINNIALVKGRPRLLNVKDIISEFVEFRHDVVVRRTKFELKKAEDRAHILEGLIIASDNIDEVIKIIRASKGTEEARENLIKRFELTDIQSRAIVEMRLRQLTGLEQDKLRAEYDEIMKTIIDLKDILSNEDRRMNIIIEELMEIKEKYGDERRTEIIYSSEEISIEDMIPNDKMVVTISHLGYLKRTNIVEYKVQNRGGRGSKGGSTRDKDFIEHLFIANNHDYVLLFTELGRCFWMRAFEIPEGNKISKGRAVQNILQLPKNDKIKAFVKIENLKDEEFLQNNYIMFCTKNGIIKKTAVEAFSRPRQNGINAITIREGDTLLEAKLTNGNCEVVMAKRSGKSIRFNESQIRSMGRTAAGVTGVRLQDENDEVVGMLCIDKDATDRTVMVISENGYGKRTFLDDPEDGEPVYRITNRGGKGVTTLKVTDKTGSLIAIKDVVEDDDLMIINKSGIAIRLSVGSFRTMGRATQGVKVINLTKKDTIASVAKIEYVEGVEEEVELDEDGNPIIADENSEETQENTTESTEGKSEESTENDTTPTAE